MVLFVCFTLARWVVNFADGFGFLQLGVQTNQMKDTPTWPVKSGRLWLLSKVQLTTSKAFFFLQDHKLTTKNTKMCMVSSSFIYQLIDYCIPLYTIYPLKWLVDLSFEMTSSINYEILWVLLGFPHWSASGRRGNSNEDSRRLMLKGNSPEMGLG